MRERDASAGRVAVTFVVAAALVVGLGLAWAFDGGDLGERVDPVSSGAPVDGPEWARALDARDEPAWSTERDAAITPLTPTVPGEAPVDDDDVSVPREGRTAALVLEVTRQGLAVPAELTVLAGAEAGRVWRTDGGQLELRGLLPGMARVEVRAGDGWTCRRELALRHGRETTWELDFGDYGRVVGRVRDVDGRALADARVELDGVVVPLRADGSFETRRHASGPGQLVARHARLVDQLSVLPAAPGDANVELVLPPGGRLVLSVAATGQLGGGDVDVLLNPRGVARVPMARSSVFPWEHLPRLRVPVGGQLVLEGLPTAQVEVLAWHGRARAQALSGWVSPERPCELAVELEPLDVLRGRVLRDGQPVADAPVRAVFANPARERKLALGEHGRLSDRVPVALPAHLDQQLRSDADGRFVLGLDPRHERPLYVTVGDPSGEVTRTRQVDVGTTELVVELDPR